MTFLMWRVHRKQLFVAGAGFVVLAAAVLLLPKSDSYAIEAVDSVTIVVPLLLGLFWGAPLLAKEFEDGTNSLAWTQGVTRRDWLNKNLGWTIVAAALCAAAVTAVVSWADPSQVSLGGSRLGPGSFDTQGIVPVAYAVFAVALGVAVGAFFRRVVPAMATTLAVFAAVRVVIAAFVRPHFMSPVSKVVALAGSGGALPPGAWLLSSTAQAPAACRPSVAASCAASHGFHIVLTYQPADRFWAFQGIETGVFVVLAALVVTMTYRVVVSRDA